ncbi:MAG: hypothetical protein AB1589_12000 [Cyanobacteriota bacterium]
MICRQTSIQQLAPRIPHPLQQGAEESALRKRGTGNRQQEDKVSKNWWRFQSPVLSPFPVRSSLFRKGAHEHRFTEIPPRDRTLKDYKSQKSRLEILGSLFFCVGFTVCEPAYSAPEVASKALSVSPTDHQENVVVTDTSTKTDALPSPSPPVVALPEEGVEKEDVGTRGRGDVAKKDTGTRGRRNPQKEEVRSVAERFSASSNGGISASKEASLHFSSIKVQPFNSSQSLSPLILNGVTAFSHTQSPIPCSIAQEQQTVTPEAHQQCNPTSPTLLTQLQVPEAWGRGKGEGGKVVLNEDLDSHPNRNFFNLSPLTQTDAIPSRLDTNDGESSLPLVGQGSPSEVLPLPPENPSETEQPASGEDPELGILRLRELPAPPPPSKPAVYLLGGAGYFRSNNIFSGVDPIDDGLFRTGLTLLAVPSLGPQTSLFASVGGNIFRYSDLSEYDYNELRFSAGIRQQIGSRSYGELGWNNRQLFSEDGGDRFLNDHSAYLELGRRDLLAERLTLDTYYQLRLSFANPSDRSQVINSVGASLGYNLSPSLLLALDYQFAFADFTQQEREDQYHQLLARMNYTLSPNSRLYLFGGKSFGSSSDSEIDFDGLVFGAGVDFSLTLF